MRGKTRDKTGDKVNTQWAKVGDKLGDGMEESGRQGGKKSEKMLGKQGNAVGDKVVDKAGNKWETSANRLQQTQWFQHFFLRATLWFLNSSRVWCADHGLSACIPHNTCHVVC